MKKLTLFFSIMLILLLLAFGCSKTPTQPDKAIYTLTIENYDQMPSSIIDFWLDGVCIGYFTTSNYKYIIICNIYQKEETKLMATFYDPILPSLEHTINTIGAVKVHWHLSSNSIIISTWPN